VTAALALVVGLIVPATARAAPQRQRQPVQALGTLAQLPGAKGCLVDRSMHTRGCKRVRALRGPGPLLGSEAIAISPGGRNVYVASSTSNAIAIFTRNRRTGQLRQASGNAGCVAKGGANGCGPAIALDGPNSVAVSADGRNVYATSVASNSVAVFRRDPGNGALTQLPGSSGCLIAVDPPSSPCGAARSLIGPDVVAVSPNGANVYVGAFFGNAIITLNRDPSTGALTQPSGTAGCISSTGAHGCAVGLALGSIEGLAVSPDGTSVYGAAATGQAVVMLTRNTGTGALTQPTDGTGCITSLPVTGCTTGVQLNGADAVAVSPDDDDVYVAALFSNALTSFTRNTSTGALTQQLGTSACVIYVLAVGCSLGRGMNGAEGVAVSPDGASLYVAAFTPGSVAVLNRNSSGAVIQKPRRPGCAVTGRVPDCLSGRGLRGASSAVVSPDGRSVYVTGNKSNAVAVFRRIAKSRGSRK
jgi:DNA-binding beta-propeller fold protein YncE